MSLAESMLAEFEAQAPITRKFLERLPEDRLTWKPHEKSMSAGQLALHIARVPGRCVRFVQQNPAQAPNFNNVPQPSSAGEILSAFEESIATVRTMLPQFSDAKMQETWRMLQGDQEVLTIPRAQFLRASCSATGFSTEASSACTSVCSTWRCRQALAPALTNCLAFCRRGKPPSTAPAACPAQMEDAGEG